ncbi:hypothetical protein [Burkholderia alba]|uniref:hypothetical protein n=1 Tax=Burkholderia alba TaxID=2683677 RepID=UPI002B05E681|nr:hypothetical protein [Burkholderia alba]
MSSAFTFALEFATGYPLCHAMLPFTVHVDLLLPSGSDSREYLGKQRRSRKAPIRMEIGTAGNLPAVSLTREIDADD